MKVRWILLISCIFAHSLSAQTPSTSQQPALSADRQMSGLARSYRVGDLPPTKFQNSNRLGALIRDSKLYLSLQDAIALALENNLDIEVERYVPHIADTDLLRAQAGSPVQGVPLSVLSGPAGVGGPVQTPPGSAPPLTPASSAIVDTGLSQAQPFCNRWASITSFTAMASPSKSKRICGNGNCGAAKAAGSSDSSIRARSR